MAFFCKQNKTKSISKKAFREVFRVATLNCIADENAYKREVGKTVINNPDGFRRWYVSKYGTVNLRDL